MTDKHSAKKEHHTFDDRSVWSLYFVALVLAILGVLRGAGVISWILLALVVVRGVQMVYEVRNAMKDK